MTKTYTHIAHQFPDVNAQAQIWAWMDTEQNGDATEFPYGTTAYFRVARQPADLAVDVRTSSDAIGARLSGPNAASDEITETVTFNRDDEATVSYPIAEIQTYEWMGNSLGAVTATGGTGIKAAIDDEVGELSITYTYNYNRYGLMVPDKSPQNEEDAWPVLVSLKGGVEGDDTRPEASLEITFYGSEAQFSDYYLYVVDDCTSDALEGVEVVFDGDPIGDTDEEGKIYVGRLLVGSSHTVRIEEDGYRVFYATTEIPAEVEDA